jgi:hypothetical protein
MGPVPGRSRAISIHDHGGIQYDDLSAEEDRVTGTKYWFAYRTFF